MTSSRVYLDNAATSWPKPETVYAAVERALRELGAPAGRSAYDEASEVERLVSETRRRLARLIGVAEQHRVIFTCNGTDGLNMALHGLLAAGDHVVTTVIEHNSVLRPLRFLESRRAVKVTCVPCDGSGFVDPDEIDAAVLPETRLIVLNHVSNVTGAIQAAREVGGIAREREVFYLVDAAQSLGHTPVSVSDLNCHLLAGPTHKGLLGPLGLGMLYVGPEVEAHLMPLRQGGTGTQSESDQQPTQLPYKYESGNHNVPAILGLNAALAYLDQQGLDTLQEHERSLAAALIEGISDVADVRVYGPAPGEPRVGVVSFNLEGYDPREVASILDASFRIQVRSGLHCAPGIHQQLNTASGGGTIRMSLGPFNDSRQIDRAIAAVAELAASRA